MKARLILSISLLLFTITMMAQSFIRPLPRPMRVQAVRSMALNDSVTTVITGNTINAVRPIVNFAAYAEPGHILMAGAGAAYEHLKYDTKAEKWKAEWSVSAIIFGGAGINPSGTDIPAPITYGLMVGFFNNLINLGPVYNAGTGKVGAAVAIGINLNN